MTPHTVENPLGTPPVCSNQWYLAVISALKCNLLDTLSTLTRPVKIYEYLEVVVLRVLVHNFLI